MCTDILYIISILQYEALKVFKYITLTVLVSSAHDRSYVRFEEFLCIRNSSRKLAFIADNLTYRFEGY